MKTVFAGIIHTKPEQMRPATQPRREKLSLVFIALHAFILAVAAALARGVAGSLRRGIAIAVGWLVRRVGLANTCGATSTTIGSDDHESGIQLNVSS
jgi:hypothetical protein